MKTNNVRNQSLEKYKTGTEQQAHKRSGGRSQLPCDLCRNWEKRDNP